jgi:UDP-N-acetylmuramoylalanine--D-glutamate ligase
MSTSLVLGLGESGLAMARWLARDGAAVRVWDSRAEPPQAAALREHVPGAELIGGALEAAGALAGVDRIFKSPGLAPGDERIAAVLAAKLPVQGELDLFAAALESLRASIDYAPKVIAVTGTNGKTTTTALTALLVARSGKRVAAAGNIGPTMLQTLADAIDAGPAESLRERLPEVWVLELSSFQLAGSDASAFQADAAALLNLSEDHLDWHRSMVDYAAAKARVFGARATIVVNRDDAAVMRLVPAPKTLPARKGRTPKVVARHVVTFGSGVPTRADDWGLAVESDMTWLVRAQGDEAAKASGEIVIQQLMPTDALRIRGRHNAMNALAALALASAIGCALAPMLHALREYRGEPHRVEYVASVAGVDAFDDSKGTNVGATEAALVGLGSERAPARLVVILGGDGKGQDFAPLGPALARHARAVVTIGRDAAAIERVVGQAGVPYERCDTLEAAVRAAFARAQRGDAVLLSPACASLDMFRNYGHRAEVFVQAVGAIADAALAGSSA